MAVEIAGLRDDWQRGAGWGKERTMQRWERGAAVGWGRPARAWVARVGVSVSCWAELPKTSVWGPRWKLGSEVKLGGKS